MSCWQCRRASFRREATKDCPEAVCCRRETAPLFLVQEGKTLSGFEKYVCLHGDGKTAALRLSSPARCQQNRQSAGRVWFYCNSVPAGSVIRTNTFTSVLRYGCIIPASTDRGCTPSVVRIQRGAFRPSAKYQTRSHSNPVSVVSVSGTVIPAVPAPAPAVITEQVCIGVNSGKTSGRTSTVKRSIRCGGDRFAQAGRSSARQVLSLPQGAISAPDHGTR